MYHEEIKQDDKILAIIVRSNFSAKDTYTFFTNDTDTQQLAYIHHPAGKIIESHIHNDVKREIYKTTEVVFIKKGKLKTNFYTEEKKIICSHILGKGDVVLLLQGGHGFEVIEEVEMFVVKQGPYAGENDKIRFTTQ